MRKHLLVWGFIDACLLAAGILSIVESIMFTRPGLMIMDLVIGSLDMDLGLTMGGMYIAAFVLSIPAILSAKEKSMLLKALNWWLVVAAAFTLAVGTKLWLVSLQQLAELSAIWAKQTASSQQAIQDYFSCCGYWNGTLSGQFTTQAGFCADATFAANQTGCQPILTSSNSPGSDFTLENIFSSIYGFEAILVCFFIATVCVINERQIDVRFAKIDEKRGGGGFV